MIHKKLNHNKLSHLACFILISLVLSACSSTGTVAGSSPVPPSPTAGVTVAPPQMASATASPSLTPTITLTPTEAPSPTPALGIGSKRVRPADGMTMMYIPEGEFLMGVSDQELDTLLNSDYCKQNKCKRSDYANEQPQHKVYLDAYWIDQTEVSNAEYAKCVAAKICKAPGQFADPAHPHWYGNPAFDQYPVVILTREQATDYCKWAGGRLPTEAEWEKAARGTDGRTYPWGNELDKSRANSCDKNCQALAGRDWKVDDGYAETSPVGNYPQGASPYGVLDIAGNVFEYITDWYNVNYYSESPYKNPKGPLTPVLPYPDTPDLKPCQVVRGGAWDEKEDDTLRTTFRRCGGGTYYCLGFRCVTDAVAQ
jgi:eukaryotic-like serine/threonine-protein kinase